MVNNTGNMENKPNDDLIRFEHFEVNGKTLFGPLDKAGKDLCKACKVKNLTEQQLQVFVTHGHKIAIRPRIRIDKKLLKMVKYEQPEL